MKKEEKIANDRVRRYLSSFKIDIKKTAVTYNFLPITHIRSRNIPKIRKNMIAPLLAVRNG